jgi:hypothetical protein
MTTGQVKVTLEPECRITIGGHFVPVLPFQAADSGAAQVRYAAIVNTVPFQGVALNVLIESPTRDGRRALLTAVSELRFRELV